MIALRSTLLNFVAPCISCSNSSNRMTFPLDRFIGLTIMTTYATFRGVVVFWSNHKSAYPISGFILDSGFIFVHVIVQRYV